MKEFILKVVVTMEGPEVAREAQEAVFRALQNLKGVDLSTLQCTAGQVPVFVHEPARLEDSVAMSNQHIIGEPLDW